MASSPVPGPRVDPGSGQQAGVRELFVSFVCFSLLVPHKHTEQWCAQGVIRFLMQFPKYWETVRYPEHYYCYYPLQ